VRRKRKVANMFAHMWYKVCFDFSAVKILVKMTAPCYCQATRWPWSAATLVPHSHTSLKAVLHGESPGDFRDQKKGDFRGEKLTPRFSGKFYGDSPWFPDSMTLIRSFKCGKSNTESDKTFTICNSTDFSDFLTQLNCILSRQVKSEMWPYQGQWGWTA
jgi:hypothetical protein